MSPPQQRALVPATFIPVQPVFSIVYYNTNITYALTCRAILPENESKKGKLLTTAIFTANLLENNKQRVPGNSAIRTHTQITENVSYFHDQDSDISYLQEVILTLRRLMSYIYGAPILDVSRSHTTTQHSR